MFYLRQENDKSRSLPAIADTLLLESLSYPWQPSVYNIHKAFRKIDHHMRIAGVGDSGGSTSTPDEKHDSNILKAGTGSEAGRSELSGIGDSVEEDLMPRKVLGKRKMLETPLSDRLEQGVQHDIENGVVL